MARKKRIYGEGTITRRTDGRFQISVPGVDGKRRYAYASNERDAEKIRRQLLAEVEQGKVPASKQPLQVHIREWLEMKKKGRDYKPNTYRNAVSRMDTYFIPLLGNITLNKLSTSHIQRMVSKLLDKRLSANTVREYISILSACLDSAVKQGKMDSNPCDRVELPRKVKSKNNFLSQDEALQLLEAVKGHKRFSVLVPLSLATQAREGELLALTWDDIDFEMGTLSINKTLTTEKQENGSNKKLDLVTVTPKSESGIRVIPLPDFAIAALRSHRTNQIEQRLASGKPNSLDLLFPSPYRGNGYYWPNSISNAFTRYVRELGYDITFHDLRHTGATLLLEAGVDANTVKERLGHSDITTTLGIYGHVTKRMKDQSANTLNNLFTEQKNGKNEAI